MFQLDTTPHPAEKDLKQLAGNAVNDHNIIDDARKLGVPWATIFALIAKYGPAFVQALADILAALKTPTPATKP